MEGWWLTGKIGHTGFTRRVQLCPKVRCEFGSSSTYDLRTVLGRLRSHKQNPVRRLLCEAQTILHVVVPDLLYCVIEDMHIFTKTDQRRRMLSERFAVLMVVLMGDDYSESSHSVMDSGDGIL